MIKLLIGKYRMHNLYAIFAKFLNICKQVIAYISNLLNGIALQPYNPKQGLAIIITRRDARLVRPCVSAYHILVTAMQF